MKDLRCVRHSFPTDHVTAQVGRVLGDEEQTAQFQTSRGRRGSLSRLPDAAVGCSVSFTKHGDQIAGCSNYILFVSILVTCSTEVESKIKHFHSAHRSAAAGVKRAEKQVCLQRSQRRSWGRAPLERVRSTCCVHGPSGAVREAD
eukprot:2293187-Amphidinium_carterae.1